MADRLRGPGRRVQSRARRLLARASSLPLLLLLALACCPVPAGSASETAFAARITLVEEGGAVARLADGGLVRLALGEAEALPQLRVGGRVYVEGWSDGSTAVTVRRLVLLDEETAVRRTREQGAEQVPGG